MRLVKSSSCFCAAVAGLILLAGNISRAANICVGPTASGNGSGSDWNNQMAWSSTPARGDTWYLCAGNYSPQNFNTPASGTTLITIKKATATDHATDTGWVSTMANQAVFSASSNPNNSVIVFNSSYWVFDGQTGGGPGSWTNGFGFKIDDSNGTLHYMGLNVNAGSYITARHFEVVGDGGNDPVDLGQASSPNNDGIAMDSGTGNLTFSYAYVHDMGRCIFLSIGTTPLTVEYVYSGKFTSTAVQHAEIASLAGSSQTFRYCVFAHIEGTGGLMFNGSGPNYIYGNVFYHVPGDDWLGGGGNGLIGAKSSNEPVQDTQIYNNTVINTGGSTAGFIGMYMPNYSGNTAYDNLFYGGNVSVGNLTGIGNGFNFTVSSNIFSNFLGLDFSLTSDTPPGTSSGSPSGNNLDPLGNTRGADGTWDVGAYQYGSPNTQEPVISNIQYSVGTNTATITWTTDENANSVVNYGLTTSYGMSVTNSSLVTSHSVTLANLAEGTYYNFQVQSIDSTNGLNSSGNQMFNTVNPAIVLGLHVVSP
jgi:hypothetical protein